MTISYYEKMPDGKLRCLDDELPFELPDGWEWCNLSMIGTTNIGLTYRPTDIEPNGVMVLRSCNIVNDQLDLSDLVRVQTGIRENQFAQKNDILICARNGSKALVGKCTLIPALGEPASFGAFMAIYRTEFFEYIVHYLRSNYFRSVFDDGNSTAIDPFNSFHAITAARSVPKPDRAVWGVLRRNISRLSRYIFSRV